MPRLWHEFRRADARERLRVLLRVSRLRQAAQTGEGGLLRVLLIRNREVPASSSLSRVLWIRASMKASNMYERFLRPTEPC
jgi:hypothetical protein